MTILKPNSEYEHFINLRNIASACGLELDRDKNEDSDDFLNVWVYSLYTYKPEPIRDIDLTILATYIAKHITNKEYTDVNRGIYLHSKMGVTKYV